MLMGDFLTLVQHNLPVKVVVFNNGALGSFPRARGFAGSCGLLLSRSWSEWWSARRS
jgi:hypothetical protein